MIIIRQMFIRVITLLAVARLSILNERFLKKYRNDVIHRRGSAYYHIEYGRHPFVHFPLMLKATISSGKASERFYNYHEKAGRRSYCNYKNVRIFGTIVHST